MDQSVLTLIKSSSKFASQNSQFSYLLHFLKISYQNYKYFYQKINCSIIFSKILIGPQIVYLWAEFNNKLNKSTSQPHSYSLICFWSTRKRNILKLKIFDIFRLWDHVFYLFWFRVAKNYFSVEFDWLF